MPDNVAPGYYLNYPLKKDDPPVMPFDGMGGAMPFGGYGGPIRPHFIHHHIHHHHHYFHYPHEYGY